MAYRLYVVEVYPRPVGSFGLLYVGSTGQPVRQRFEQHIRGERSQWLKRRDIWRLRMELTLGVPPQATRDAGEAQEMDLAARLAELGFDTHCDGVGRAGSLSQSSLPSDHLLKIGPLLGRLARELSPDPPIGLVV